LVEGNDSKSGTTAAETLEISLVVFNCGMAVARGGDDDTLQFENLARPGPATAFGMTEFLLILLSRLCLAGSHALIYVSYIFHVLAGARATPGPS